MSTDEQITALNIPILTSVTVTESGYQIQTLLPPSHTTSSLPACSLYSRVFDLFQGSTRNFFRQCKLLCKVDFKLPFIQSSCQLISFSILLILCYVTLQTQFIVPMPAGCCKHGCCFFCTTHMVSCQILVIYFIVYSGAAVFVCKPTCDLGWDDEIHVVEYLD